MNNSLFILKDNNFQYLNLINCNEEKKDFTNKLVSLECNDLQDVSIGKINNFKMIDNHTAVLLCDNKLAVYDIAQSKLISLISKSNVDSDSDDDFYNRRVYQTMKNSLFTQSSREPKLLKIQDHNCLWFQDENLSFVDVRTSKIKSCMKSSFNCFDINSVELTTLHNNCLNYFDVRKLDYNIKMNGSIYLQNFDRDPYTYFKSDNHRMGLMSSSSLLFKNHGEINQTVGKEVVNYSTGPTNSIQTDRLCSKHTSSPFVQLNDFDYFDRFYCTFTHSLICSENCSSVVNLYEVKSVNLYDY